MAKAMKLKGDGRTITVRVPISIKNRGGRKVVLAPDGVQRNSGELRCQQIDSATIKALARAFRWREMLEDGTYSTIKEVADAERIAETYVGRVLRLSLLAPDIVETILSGRLPSDISLPFFMRPFPSEWSGQRLLVWASASV